jgi:hypothetical protein
MLSIEVKLSWSNERIALAVLAPVFLSLAIGLWLNSRDWTDPTMTSTAWGVASYVATAGGFLGVLLGLLSSLSK